MKKLVITGLFLICNQSLAVERSEFSLARRSIATVMFCGLGGAAVGLSTLSFYGKPEEHIGNLYLGLGLGILAGSAWMVSTATANSERSWSREGFAEKAPVQIAKVQPPVFSMSWQIP